MSDALEDATNHPDPAAAFRVLLQLSYLRSMFVVGQALWLQYPDEDSWMAALQDPTFRNTIVGFASLIMDLKSNTLTGASPEELMALSQTQYSTALLHVTELAVVLGIDPGDLLAVLVHI